MLDAPRRPVERELAADGRGHVGPGDLLQHDGGLDVAQAQAAPALPHGDAEQVGRGERLAHLRRHCALLVGLVRPWRHLATRHVAGELAEGGLVVALGQQVDARSRCAHQPSSVPTMPTKLTPSPGAPPRLWVSPSVRPGADGVDLALRRRLAPQLQPALEEHAQARGADRVPEGLQPAVGVDRQVAVAVEGALEHLLPRRAALGETEVLHQHELGRREAVVHLRHGELRPGLGDARLLVGVGRRAHDLLEGCVVVGGVDRPGRRPGHEGERLHVERVSQ